MFASSSSSGGSQGEYRGYEATMAASSSLIADGMLAVPASCRLLAIITGRQVWLNSFPKTTLRR
jgi:hypothetical protein